MKMSNLSKVGVAGDMDDEMVNLPKVEVGAVLELKVGVGDVSNF